MSLWCHGRTRAEGIGRLRWGYEGLCVLNLDLRPAHCSESKSSACQMADGPSQMVHGPLPQARHAYSLDKHLHRR